VNTSASSEHQCVEPVQAAGGSDLLANAMGVDADGKRGGRITVGARGDEFAGVADSAHSGVWVAPAARPPRAGHALTLVVGTLLAGSLLP
jgi:hypothetical protein